MNLLINLIFFASGMSALLFESLWFRQTSLVFGSSVWAASLVLSSFMGGLALGNTLSGRYGEGVKNSLWLYGILEGIIGVSGLALVLLFPFLTAGLVPLFKPVLFHETGLNVLRFATAFLLMLIPTSAMGATLPLVVQHLSRKNRNFGGALGQLYGWNTLGAVIGVLSGEIVLIKYLGIRGTGIVAAGINFFLFVLVMALTKKGGTTETSLSRPVSEKQSHTLSSTRFLIAVFLCGAVLLAAEVIWTRFLLLFVYGTSLAFSTLLAAVLCGIGIGGLLAFIFRNLFVVSCLSGILLVLSYWKFESVLSLYRSSNASQFISLIPLVLSIAFPVSLFSGVLFTQMGAALKQKVGGEAGPVGLLTLTNTLGGMCGALVGGFFLLPRFGVERSFFILALAYGLVAVLTFPEGGRRFFKTYRLIFVTVAGVYLFAIAFFPFGLMRDRYLLYSQYSYRIHGEKEVGYREGITETIAYLRKDFLGAPYYYRLITNSYPMTSTNWQARRYMKLYVYLPVALHPHPKKALLISYGAGSTAKAMTDTEGFESIDVIDISRDILDMNRIVFPDLRDYPLADKRVRVHVEDGRYFLQTTDQTFDLITAEPPPPKNAGIQNLYSQEYFQLILGRLSTGGMVTYWLPPIQLHEQETRSIIKAFCNVFADCTLWSGSQMDWMLLGTRHATEAVSAEAFGRQWQDPKVAPEMRALGFEVPEQMGALFIADSQDLKEMTRGAEPLVDNYPYRISPQPTDLDRMAREYLAWVDPLQTRRRFWESPFIQRLWPQPLIQKSLDFFEVQFLMTKFRVERPNHAETLNLLDFVLTKTDLKAPVYWLMDSDEDKGRIARETAWKEEDREQAELQLGINALAERQYAAAEAHFQNAQGVRNSPQLQYLTLYRDYLRSK